MKVQLHCMYFAIICIFCIIDVSSEHAEDTDMMVHAEDDDMLENWETSKPKFSLHRHKRGWWRKTGCWFKNWFVRCPPPDTTGPDMHNCPDITSVFHAAAGQTSVRVTWDTPTATDPSGVENGYPKKETPSLAPGANFPAGTYKIKYVAKDNKGNYNNCPAIEFSVIVTTCSRPTDLEPVHGYVRCPHNPPIFGDTCQFDCDEGYELEEPEYSEHTCSSTQNLDGIGYYSPAIVPLNCIEISCQLPVLPNGVQSTTCTNGIRYRSICQYQCWDGFSLTEGSLTRRTCQSDSTWSNDLPTCTEHQCQATILPHNVEFVRCTNGFHYRSTCLYECRENYVLEEGSVTTRTCQADETWSNDIPICIELECQASVLSDNVVFLGCTNGFHYRSTCLYECRENSFLEEGSVTTRTCQVDETWSNDMPICIELECEASVVSDNVDLSGCTNGFHYGSTCLYECRDNYMLEEGSVRTRTCQANETWSNDMPTCIDTTPPILENCTVSFTVYTERDQRAYIDYIPPNAVDNLGNPVEVHMTYGIAPDSYIAINRIDYFQNIHEVLYTAIDSNGVEAQSLCIFTIRISELTCPILEYTQRLIVNCSSPLVYGANCTFECDHGYPLIGATEVSCEKIEGDPPTADWNWGDGNASYCDVAECPDLHAPDNGAMSCVSISFGLYCTMSCNSEYDIPQTVSITGEFVCDDARGWLQDTNVPDCSELLPAYRIRLPTEFFYYNGDCTDQTVIDEIQESVVARLSSSVFSSLCTSDTACSAANVVVTCGESTRKKRSNGLQRKLLTTNTDTLIVSLDFIIEMDVNDDYNSLASELYDMFDAVHAEIREGRFNIHGLTLDPSTFADGGPTLDCPDGAIPNYGTLSCRLCPTGTYYDYDLDDCQDCPIGTYQDNEHQYECIPCDEGYSTRSEGSRRADKCTRLCDTGHMSADGLVPCVPCPLNTYQASIGQTSCVACPEGANTTSESSTLLLHCKFPGEDDLCQNDTCNGHGLCVPLLDAYRCMCVHRYSGVNCTIPLHVFCQNDTCSGHGLCVPLEDTYRCECVHGFSGDDCSIPPHVLCQNDTCDGHGLCVPLDDTYRCECVNGYSGENCTIPPHVFCQNDTCNGHGLCVPLEDTYGCECVDGYSGDDCSIPPALCINNLCFEGSSCESAVTNYTCICPGGRTGDFCELEIVDGGWGDVGDWGSCSVSCGTGTRTTIRLCNNPSPENGGADCVGEVTITEECVMDDCPVCPVPRRPYGAILDCNPIGEDIVCDIQCRDSTTNTVDYPMTLNCGPNTEYVWNPDIPAKGLPKCVASSKPEIVSITTTVEYVGISNADNENALNNIDTHTSSLIPNTECISSGVCDLQNSANILQYAKRKRRTSSFDVLVTIMVTLNPENLTTATFLEYIDDMVDHAYTMNNASEDGTFDFTIGGITYNIDPDSFLMSGDIDCPGTLVSYGAVCGNCPPGTYYWGGVCEPCEIGSYQDQEGQTYCIMCDNGYTTAINGSESVESCIIEVGETSTTETSYQGSSTSSTYIKIGDSKLGVIIALTTVAVALIVMIITGVMIYHCCCKNTVSKIKRSRSTASIRPYSPRPETPSNIHMSIDGAPVVMVPMVPPQDTKLPASAMPKKKSFIV